MNVHSIETINKIKVKWNLFKENTTTKLINKHQRKAIRETRDGFRKQTSLQINVFNFPQDNTRIQKHTKLHQSSLLQNKIIKIPTSESNHRERNRRASNNFFQFPRGYILMNDRTKHTEKIKYLRGKILWVTYLIQL